MISPIDFPRLTPGNHRVTSPATTDYNCVAWSAENTERWWQPGVYWPVDAPSGEYGIEVLTRALACLGYEDCPDGSLEPGFLKVALYASGPFYTHAARQLPTGRWTSKLGAMEDVEHETAEDVAGGVYGEVVGYMKRPVGDRGHDVSTNQESEATATPATLRGGDERIPALDLVRGVALLGILLANMPLFMGPMFNDGSRIGDGSLADTIVVALTLFFIDGKFITLFSILFGAGLTLQIDRAAERGQPFVGYYLRRQALLLLIGLGHGLLLWSGDILATYAVVGVVALFVLRLRSRAVTWVMGGAYTWAYLMLLLAILGWVGVMLAPPEWLDEAGAAVNQKPEPGDPGAAIQQFFSAENEVRAFQQADFPAMVLIRLVALVGMAFQALVAVGWYVLGCFLLGGQFLRHGVFRDPDAHRALTRRMIVIGFAVGLTCHVAAVVALFAGGSKNPLGLDMYGALAVLLNLLGALAQALAYLGLFLRWSASGRLPWFQERFRAVGRMALTNYLLQSVLCGLVFYGYGLGLFARLSRTQSLLVVAGVWLFNLVFSWLWLRFFTMGPVEWLWRGLAEWRFKPLLRRPEGAP